MTDAERALKEQAYSYVNEANVALAGDEYHTAAHLLQLAEQLAAGLPNDPDLTAWIEGSWTFWSANAPRPMTAM